MDYELSPTGKSDKPPLGMFVTNHFNKKGKHKVYPTKHYATKNLIHRRILSSIFDFAFYKIQVWGMEFFKTSHAMLLGCLGHPYLYDELNLLNH